MDSLVTFKLSLKQANLVIESLKERQHLLEEHGKLEPEGPLDSEVFFKSADRIRESRRKSIELAEIIKSIEG